MDTVTCDIPGSYLAELTRRVGTNAAAYRRW